MSLWQRVRFLGWLHLWDTTRYRLIAVIAGKTMVILNARLFVQPTDPFCQAIFPDSGAFIRRNTFTTQTPAEWERGRVA